MDCVCGCGAKLPRRLSETNIEAGRVALELFAWDRARAGSHLRDYPDAELLMARGASCYQRLLRELHGEGDGDATGEAKEWLADSLVRRRDLPHMTERGSWFTPDKLRLTEGDLDRLDRRHPERSFSAAGDDPGTASQLDRLATLHADGVITDEEYTAAMARLAERD